MYYRGAAAAILVYDITQAQSFERLKNWVLELQSKGPADLALAIAGNKSDLKDQRQINYEMAKAYADEIGALYMETSAKEDVNVQDLFINLSTRLPAPPVQDPNVLKNVNTVNNNTKSKSCCE